MSTVTKPMALDETLQRVADALEEIAGGGLINDAAGDGSTDKAWSADKLVREFAKKYEKPISGIPYSDLADGVIPVTDVKVNGTSVVNSGIANVPIATDEQVTTAVSAWLDENIPTGETVVVDSSLNISGAAADAAKTGEIKTIINNGFELVNILDLKRAIYNTATVGSTIGNSVTSDNYRGQSFAVSKGDVYVISGKGGVNYRLWAFTNTSKSITSNADSSATAQNLELMAEADGYLYVAFNITSETTPALYLKSAKAFEKAKQADNKIDELTNSCFGKYHSANYFNKDWQYDSGFVLDDGTLRTDGAYGTYKTANPFKLSAGTWTIYNTQDDTADPPSTKYGVYVKDSVTNAVIYSDAKLSYYTFTLVHDGIVIISIPSSYKVWDTTMLVQGETIIDFVPYESAYYVKDDVKLSASHLIDFGDLPYQNVLFNKKYVAAGDSYTGWSDASYIGGLYDEERVTYDREIRLRNGMNGINAGISGSTMALGKSDLQDKESVDANAFSNARYTAIPSDTDILTIAFGINDSVLCDLGQLGDTQNTTFYGAWDKVLKYYAEYRPQMKIGIICFARDNNSFYQAVLEIAKYYGIPLLDFFGGENTPMYVDGKAYSVDADMKATRKAYFCGHEHESNVEETFRGKTYMTVITEASPGHPGYRAHIDESSIIEAFIRSL